MCGHAFNLLPASVPVYINQPETVTNHGWDGSCPILQLLDVELGLLG